MGLEGGEQAGADIAGRAKEEDFHVGCEEEDVMIMIAKPDQLGTRDGRLYDVIFVYDPMPEVDAPRQQGLQANLHIVKQNPIDPTITTI